LNINFQQSFTSDLTAVFQHFFADAKSKNKPAFNKPIGVMLAAG
jgi:hypothetical protein